jgi:hypothetical protein
VIELIGIRLVGLFGGLLFGFEEVRSVLQYFTLQVLTMAG